MWRLAIGISSIWISLESFLGEDEEKKKTRYKEKRERKIEMHATFNLIHRGKKLVVLVEEI